MSQKAGTLRALVTGANGLLGSRLTPLLCETFPDARIFAACKSGIVRGARGSQVLPGDLTDASVRRAALTIARPDIIINLASLTDVDLCEREPHLAHTVNTELVSLLMREAPDAKFVLISSDYVFDGDRGCYLPQDPANPKTVYGMTKLAAELIVAQNAKSLIIRAAGTFDWYSQNNFFWFVAKRLGAGKNINAAQDTFYTPIWAQDLSTAIVRAIRANMSGILHLAGADRVSRYDFALLVARELMLAQMSAIPTMQSSLPWRAKRPTDSSLNSVECYRKLNLSPPGLPDAIKRCSEEMHEAYRLTR